ncbi:MAG: SDR family oxidoreductase [Bacteroidales bacterium]|nr:SDR family oxidoreductase [Bacteroidales bacterium]
METLSNKVAIVTGAGRGMGRCIAELFAAEGAKVYAFDLQFAENEHIAVLRGNADPVEKIVVDICDFAAVKDAVVKIKKQEGRIDILVNNAGLISYEMMSMIDYERFRKMIEVNVVSLIYLMQLVARVMQRQQSGSIVNMASMVGLKGAAGQLSYSATKGAVISATKSAAKELASSKIRVNAVAPGMVGTERFKNVLQEKFSEKINDVPFGRLAEPEEVANLCLFLASDASSYITGQVIGIDGGVVM